MSALALPSLYPASCLLLFVCRSDDQPLHRLPRHALAVRALGVVQRRFRALVTEHAGDLVRIGAGLGELVADRVPQAVQAALLRQSSFVAPLAELLRQVIRLEWPPALGDEEGGQSGDQRGKSAKSALHYTQGADRKRMA